MTERFLELYRTYIKRPGSEKLLQWLDDSDFFYAPASTKFHGSHEGGLCEHSVNVWEELVRLLKAYPEIKTNGETVVIISLLHDLCKVNVYKVESRNKKENGIWKTVPYYVFDEDFCYGGHGSKSVYLIQKYFPLTDEEAVAINCHMSTWDGNSSVGNAYQHYPLAWLLHVADESATYIREGE
jgi:HD superfamily phosphohydrolase YqeK